MSKRKTAVYIRVSSEGQRFDSQKRELTAFCEARGWTVSFYADKLSGKLTTRTELERLLSDIRSGRKIERVVCYKLDRLGRSLAHLAMIVEELTKARIPLICASQGIDTSEDSSSGRLQLHVFMAIAEFERGLIRERVKSGLAAARARGVVFGRPRTLDVHRAKAVAMHDRGASLRDIAKECGIGVSSAHSILRIALTKAVRKRQNGQSVRKP